MTNKQPDFLPAGLLGQLLMRLEIPVPQGALDEACEKSKKESTDPVNQLGSILKAVNRRNVRAAILRWDRFDHRQLPALIWHKDNWWLAETGENNFIHLVNEVKEEKDISDFFAMGHLSSELERLTRYALDDLKKKEQYQQTVI